MKKTVLFVLFLMLLVIAIAASATALADTQEMQETETYKNLYASVQGETNASAAYKAFAEKAQADGYPAVARLFLATADAEAKHAADEWAILEGMGATVRPVAEAPKVGTTAENLKTAFDGETYEYTVMYPEFVAAAQAEGMTAAATIFNRAMRAEQVHAGNYADVLANLSDAEYLNTKYATLYRCIVCGEVVTALPARCPICGASGDSFVVYNRTYFNLYASVQGETNANATYKAFAEKAQADGYPAVARLFLATADAEAKHAADEWAILEGMGATVRPVAAAPSVGTTAENLKAAFDGETYEYTVMYPDFLAAAQSEGMAAAATIFDRAMRAEQVHAGNYADVLANLDNAAYLNTKYATVYRCIVCGEVVTERPTRCPICNASGDSFAMYNGTYFNLYASVQGETNANAAYMAFAAKALDEGYPAVARLFLATADAEAKHAADEWAILEGMGATVRPDAAVPNVGTTAENLQEAFNGETYEYTVMYPDFLAVAQAEGMTAAVTIFNRAMRAEQVHAGNYADVLANLDDANYLNAKYAILFRCIVCGEVVTERPTRCPICGASGDSFAVYRDGPVLLSLGATAESDINGDVEYFLSLRGAENVLTIEVEFVIDGSMLASKGVIAESGFSTISDIAWRYSGSNLWIGKITLSYQSGGGLTGFDSEPSADIAKFVFDARAFGKAAMTLTNLRVTGFDAETHQVVDFAYIVLAGEAVTSIDQLIFSKYDLNRDNVVDALDLGIMLLYCGFDKDSPNWSTLVKVNDSRGKGVTASMCDVNDDGVIDMLDLLDLFIHYTK